MIKPNNIVDLLFMIKKRPGAYIGEKSIIKLKSFLDGYRCALEYENIEYGVNIYRLFNDWIAKKYNIISVELWDAFLLRKTENAAAAFDLFFEEFDLFLRENDIEIPVVG